MSPMSEAGGKSGKKLYYLTYLPCSGTERHIPYSYMEEWSYKNTPPDLCHCWPELALGQPGITNRACVSVVCFVSVLTGGELCN